MQGCGEDVVVLDCFHQPLAVQADLAALARRVLDRARGVGGEALLLLGPGSAEKVLVRSFALDGSEGEPSTHALRCAARYASDSGAVSHTSFALETLHGAVRVQMVDSVNVRVDLGVPAAPDTLAEIRESTAASFTRTVSLDGRELAYVPVSVGTPFGIFFVPDFSFPMTTMARRIVRHPDFPDGTGVCFTLVQDRGCLRLRAWEGGRRKVSCPAAAAAVVAAVVSGFADRDVLARMPGGDLYLEWGEDNRLRLTGPAVYVFTCTFPFEE